MARAKAGMSQREVADAAHGSSPPSPASSPGPGSRHCPFWLRILAAIDLEKQSTLEASDNHDDVLHAEDKRLRQTSARGGGQRARPIRRPSAKERRWGTGHDAFDPKRIVEH